MMFSSFKEKINSYSTSIKEYFTGTDSHRQRITTKSLDEYIDYKLTQYNQLDTLNTITMSEIPWSPRFKAKIIRSIHNKVTNENFVLFSTCTDHDKSADVMDIRYHGGTIALENQLNHLKQRIIEKDNKCNLKVIIPIAQSQEYIFSIFERGHYTELELNIKNGELIEAKHIDSKSFKESSIYSTKNIQDAISNCFGKDISLKHEYTGEQQVLDNVNCGRYVGNRILKTIGIDQNKYDTFEEIDRFISAEDDFDKQNALIKECNMIGDNFEIIANSDYQDTLLNNSTDYIGEGSEFDFCE